jgi:hypothetical protein
MGRAAAITGEEHASGLRAGEGVEEDANPLFSVAMHAAVGAAIARLEDAHAHLLPPALPAAQALVELYLLRGEVAAAAVVAEWGCTHAHTTAQCERLIHPLLLLLPASAPAPASTGPAYSPSLDLDRVQETKEKSPKDQRERDPSETEENGSRDSQAPCSDLDLTAQAKQEQDLDLTAQEKHGQDLDLTAESNTAHTEGVTSMTVAGTSPGKRVNRDETGAESEKDGADVRRYSREVLLSFRQHHTSSRFPFPFELSVREAELSASENTPDVAGESDELQEVSEKGGGGSSVGGGRVGLGANHETRSGLLDSSHQEASAKALLLVDHDAFDSDLYSALHSTLGEGCHLPKPESKTRVVEVKAANGGITSADAEGVATTTVAGTSPGQMAKCDETGAGADVRRYSREFLLWFRQHHTSRRVF